MAATPPFPYETRVNILHQPLEVIDEKALADACQFDWYNQTLCKVNESVVRLGVVQGEYHWHRHDQDDEFFYVVDGQLSIDLEGRTIELSSRQGFVVPKGVLHRTRAARRTVILMVENAGIIPTGDAPPNDRSRLVSPEAGQLLGTNLADTFQIPDHSRSLTAHCLRTSSAFNIAGSSWLDGFKPWVLLESLLRYLRGLHQKRNPR